MGRLTEFFKYLNAEPKDLMDLKKTMTHIDIDRNQDIYKPIRRKHLSDNKK